ncbi:MAG: HAMP domain-containing histidine kinase [Flavobacteriaceae bacterium]|nr:HAMP domain-containing histidine kinase [Flavobacteriaceae bacterium]
MNNFKYKQILYFISIVILLTIGVQGYWSYKNYQSEKQHFIADVQTCLDNAVDAYYTKIAKENTRAYILDSIPSDSLFMNINIKKFLSEGDSIPSSFERLHLNDSNNTRKISIIKSNSFNGFNFKPNSNDPTIIYKTIDSLKGVIPRHLEMLTSKIVVSFSEDSLSLNRIDSLILTELKRKEIRLNYGLYYKNEWGENQKLRRTFINNSELSATTGSTFIMDGSKLQMHYNNNSLILLKRNSISLFISFLLVSSIVFCLIYLLKIIQKQKELAEIKNDLISNITHEFKTPLATISVALEGIQRFNLTNDTEKSKKYAEMSKTEVDKLTFMVEKLLETATLDSNNLQLNLEETNLVSLVEKVSAINPELTNGKEITFTSNKEECLVNIDRFHFENAFNNIIDNAIKYGGNKIEVSLEISNSEVIISIKDNGKGLSKQQASKIFEKFYRVPKGNTHDVKGFGIGLYYSKNIIEKHGGSIRVAVEDGTEFRIVVPI